jgi:hypothetical protein
MSKVTVLPSEWPDDAIKFSIEHRNLRDGSVSFHTFYAPNDVLSRTIVETKPLECGVVRG